MPESKQQLSIIIPCYNEEEGIPQLALKLEPVINELKEQYTPQLIFVNDGSTDKTANLLHKYFGTWPQTLIITHEKNKNLGAALRTGFSHATGEFIACLDSDCTYDPQLLFPMLQMIDTTEQNIDIVTVSPYHPNGKVNNIPAYRLFLSKSASNIYKFLLQSGIYSPGGMVRIYRKKVIENITSDKDNFLFVPEFLMKAYLHGYTIKEFPTTLNVRQYGTSKMKLLNTIVSHAKLMGRIIRYKITKKPI